jgi:hypothetical protein
MKDKFVRVLPLIVAIIGICFVLILDERIK